LSGERKKIQVPLGTTKYPISNQSSYQMVNGTSLGVGKRKFGFGMIFSYVASGMKLDVTFEQNPLEKNLGV
jgi:hypothetical protein